MREKDEDMLRGERPANEAEAFLRRPLMIGDEQLEADLSGALWWPSRATLVVSDLHFEKGSSFAARGQMLPPYDTRQTLARLGAVLDRYAARCVVALGDSLHDCAGAARIGSDDLATLRRLQRRRTWIWVRGNHDPHIGGALGGDVVDRLKLAGLTFRHEASPVGLPDWQGEISGHLHPAARVALDGCALRRRCFVGDGTRMVLPAFGTFTGGLNILDAAFAELFAKGPHHVLLLGERGVYPVARERLRCD